MLGRSRSLVTKGGFAFTRPPFIASFTELVSGSDDMLGADAVSQQERSLRGLFNCGARGSGAVAQPAPLAVVLLLRHPGQALPPPSCSWTRPSSSMAGALWTW